MRARERPSAAAAALALVLVLVCFSDLVPGARGQSDTVPEQQGNLTGIVGRQCNQEANCYDVTGQNGFGQHVNFTFIIRCDGAANNTVVKEIFLFGQRQICIGPQDGTSVVKRFCTVYMRGVDPFTGLATQFAEFTDTCGTVNLATYRASICGDESPDDWGEHCGFDPFCQASNGTWWRSFVILLVVVVIISAIMGFAYTIFFHTVRKQRTKNLEDMALLTGPLFERWKVAQSALMGATRPTMTPGAGPASNSAVYNGPDDTPPEKRGRSRGRSMSRGPRRDYDMNDHHMSPDGRIPVQRPNSGKRDVDLDDERDLDFDDDHHRRRLSGSYDDDERGDSGSDVDERDRLTGARSEVYFNKRL